MAVSNVFFNDQWLGKYSQPSFNRPVEQVEAMVHGILDAPDNGFVVLTSGGTASIEAAIKTARDWARAERPEIKNLKMVLPYSAHPAFNKAAAIFWHSGRACAPGQRLARRCFRNGGGR